MVESDEMQKQEHLRKQVERQARRMRKAERDRDSLLAQTIYLGTLGLLFVLPVIGGAYLGRWIDSFTEGYAIRWTLSLMLLGVITGVINVYLYIKE